MSRGSKGSEPTLRGEECGSGRLVDPSPVARCRYKAGSVREDDIRPLRVTGPSPRDTPECSAVVCPRLRFTQNPVYRHMRACLTRPPAVGFGIDLSCRDIAQLTTLPPCWFFRCAVPAACRGGHHRVPPWRKCRLHETRSPASSDAPNLLPMSRFVSRRDRKAIRREPKYARPAAAQHLGLRRRSLPVPTGYAKEVNSDRPADR